MTNQVITLSPGGGITGRFIPTDRFKTARLSLTLYLPMRAETAAGYALLPNLLSGAGEDYPDLRALNLRLDSLYNAALFANCDKLGDLQIIRMGFSCIENRFVPDGTDVFGECARLLSGLVFRPLCDEGGFEKELFEREKRMLIERIDGEINDKGKYASRRCEELLCAGEPYGLPLYGSRESAAALDRRGAYELWQRALREAYVCVTVTGAENKPEAVKLFADGFAALGRPQVALPGKATVPAARDGVQSAEDHMSVVQGKLCMGFRTEMSGTDAESYPLMVMADLFGGGTYSRLFSVVREKLSLCYYCSARANRRKGVLMVSSGVEFENLERAKNEILNQLEIVRRGEFTDDELEASRRSLCDSLRSLSDSQSGLERWYSDRALDEKVLSPEQLAELIRGVTRERVVDAAKGVRLDTVYMLKGEEQSNG